MTYNTAGTHILEISVTRNKSKYIRRISSDISSQKLKYYSLSSMDLNSKEPVTYSEKFNMQICVQEIRLKLQIQVYIFNREISITRLKNWQSGRWKNLRLKYNYCCAEGQNMKIYGVGKGEGL
jgi:hypothetical protein